MNRRTGAKVVGIVALAGLAGGLVLFSNPFKRSKLAIELNSIASIKVFGGHGNHIVEGDSLRVVIDGINVAADGIESEERPEWHRREPTITNRHPEPAWWIYMTKNDGTEITACVWADQFGAMLIGERWYTIGHERYYRLHDLLDRLPRDPN
jgi:hypothetical protein